MLVTASYLLPFNKGQALAPSKSWPGRWRAAGELPCGDHAKRRTLGPQLRRHERTL